MTEPTMQDTRTAVILQMVQALESTDSIKDINKHFNEIIKKCEGNGKDSLLETIKMCGKEYDPEALIIGATIGTTVYMLANNMNAEKTAELTTEQLSQLYG